MSTTHPTELIQVDKELLPVEPNAKEKRISPFQNDDAYINEYVRNPHLGKANAYRIATGDSTSYNRQRAHVMHARLLTQINEALKTRILGVVGFATNRLFYLAEHAESENVQAACASKLLEFGMKFSPQEINAEENRTREQIKKDIKNCIKNIEQTTGKKHVI